jgi:hypothetical protein
MLTIISSFMSNEDMYVDPEGHGYSIALSPPDSFDTISLGSSSSLESVLSVSLHEVASRGDLKAIDKFLKLEGVDINATDKDGRRALHLYMFLKKYNNNGP